MSLDQLELAAAAADRIQAERDLLLLELIAAGTAAGFGNGAKGYKLLADKLQSMISDYGGGN